MVRKMAAEAVTTVDGAGPGSDQQRATVVLLQEPRYYLLLVLGERIEGESWNRGKLVGDRKKLAKQGILRVPMLDAGDEGARSEEGKITARFPCSSNQRIGQAKQPAEFLGIANRLLHLPLPGKWQGRG